MKKFYEAPQMKVVKTTVRHQMLAGSDFYAKSNPDGNETEKYEDGGSTDSWFTGN